MIPARLLLILRHRQPALAYAAPAWTAVIGPYKVAAGIPHLSGSVAGGSHVINSVAGGAHVAGATAGMPADQ